MLKFDFKLAIVRLFKNKTFFIVNLFGITIAITACIFIGSFVVTEFDYDRFHSNAADIFRVEHNDFREGQFIKSAGTVSALGPEIASIAPEVRAFCRIHPERGQIVVKNNGLETPFLENVYYADASIWSMFSFQLLIGNTKNIFKSPNTAAISESAAKKYFGETNVTGKTIIFNHKYSGQNEFVIEAVFRDIPFNSHLQFDILFSYASLGQKMDTNWDWGGDYTYLLLASDAHAKDVENKLITIVKTFHVAGSQDTYSLLGLPDIHLNATANNEIAKTSSLSVVKLLIVICIFILIIAIINYANSSFAMALQRAREIGLQKIFGATKKNLFYQFLSQSIISILIALFLSAILIFVLFPVFSRISTVSVHVFVQQWPLWILITLLFMVAVLLCGFYPSYFVSTGKSLEAVNGKFVTSTKGIRFRKVLIGAQLLISFVLLGSTLAVHSQLSFLKSQAIGINPNRVLVIQEPILGSRTATGNFNPLKTELLRNASIKDITHSSAVPGQPITWERADIKFKNLESEERHSIKIMGVDYNFFEFYELKMLAGRTFSIDSESEITSVVISRATAKRFGYSNLSDIVGESIFIGRNHLKIIGVVEDYHHLYFKHSIEPQIYKLSDARAPMYSIRFHDVEMNSIIAAVKDHWVLTYPGNFFEFFYLDDYYNRQYASEDKLYELIFHFCFLAMILSILGLWSFTLYSNMQRLKEIAIRKVLGSTNFNIITLLLREYVLIAAIAIALGCPLIHFFVNEWLSYYAIRIPISSDLFVAPGILLLVLTVLTISTHAHHAASSQPTKFLSSELRS